MSFKNNIGSDEDGDYIDPFELERLEKWNIIKHFRLHDYMSCEETKKVLKQHWKKEFHAVEDELYEMFDTYHTYMNEKHFNVLSFADTVHRCDFVSLITHHITKNYDTSIFEEEPQLAEPLVRKINDIIHLRKEQKKLSLKEKYKTSNKTFNWNTKKYI